MTQAISSKLLVTKKDILVFKQLLKEKGKIAILTHIFPDQDAITSGLILLRVLESQKNAQVKFFVEKPIAPDLLQIPKANKLNATDNIITELKKFSPSVIVLTDINHYSRLTHFDHKNIIKFFKDKKIYIIDHHQTKATIKNANKIQKVYISTTQILDFLLKHNHFKTNPLINSLIGIGILSDSNILNTLPKRRDLQQLTFLELAELLKTSKLNLKEMISLSKINLHSNYIQHFKRLAGRLKTTTKLIYTYVDFTNTYDNKDEINRVVIFFMAKILEATTIPIKFIFYKIDKKCFLTIHSQRYNILPIAENLGGGGHAHMAGATFNCPNKTNFQKYLNIIKKQAKELIKQAPK